MTIRTTEKTVTFERPFVLAGFDEVLPAGDYSVEIDEELLQGLSFPAFHRVRAVIALHPTDGRSRTLTIAANALDAALARDRAAVAGAPPQTPDGEAKGTTKVDRRAIERGENEGMALPAGPTSASGPAPLSGADFNRYEPIASGNSHEKR